MQVSLIVAAAHNGAIGKEGTMPWHLPADLKHFKNITWGLPIIMGRKTFDSLGKPLPGRTNIVITRQTNWNPSNEVIVVADVITALSKAKECGVKEVVVIGGGEIYICFLTWQRGSILRGLTLLLMQILFFLPFILKIGNSLVNWIERLTQSMLIIILSRFGSD